MSDFWSLRRDEVFNREQLATVYDKTLADVLQRYDELKQQSDYVSRKKTLELEKRMLLLEDIIFDLYSALRSLR